MNDKILLSINYFFKKELSVLIHEQRENRLKIKLELRNYTHLFTWLIVREPTIINE